ncbi:uncharacterized protein UHO2_00381 [Ustilago hordei]|uniref:uncharacterized protein n=1 Tax=Ustilago hordei TaxID=120017 RepID=UPI001A4CA966|nr:uncharacterized protein UHO2_00381 [Ustilago hordei]SYW81877.1 uncharacterized protein UHO2_00381 [Ustilago hordei]
MESVDEATDKIPAGSIKEKPNIKTGGKESHFGLTAIDDRKERNLDPTVHEALAGQEKRFWEEAMCKELEGLEAMGTWEVVDIPPGVSTANTRWVLKVKTDANLIPTKCHRVGAGSVRRMI